MRGWWRINGWKIVYPFIALCVTFFLFASTWAVAAVLASSHHHIDCGPEGKPALDGRACIDREPVTIP